MAASMKNSNARIKSHEDKQPVGKTIWDFLSKVFDAIKQPKTLIPALIIASTSSVALVYFTNPELSFKDGKLTFSPTPKPGKIPSGSKSEILINSLGKLVEKGEELKKTYVIESITVLIKYEDETRNGVPKRVARWNTVYTIRALRDITKEEVLFQEEYSSRYTIPIPEPGSEKEVKVTNNAYNVELEMAAGESRTITTAATSLYDLPLQNGRLAFNEQIELGMNQDFFSYPNKEDVIGEIVMRIESESLLLEQVGEGARRSASEGEKRLAKAAHAVQKAGKSVLSARWLNVMPNQEVGLYFRAEPRPLE